MFNSRKRKKKKRLLWKLLGVYLLYVALGATLPFIKMKPVSQEFADSFSYDGYFGDEEGPDRARLVEHNQDALDIRLRMIEEARESIIISTFDIKTGESTTDIFAALLAAADRGVNIQILVDGFSGFAHMGGRSLFYGVGNHENLEIRFYNIPNPLKPWTINGRMHDKYVIVDNKLLLVGGRNYFDYFVGEYADKKTGYDREVLIYNQLYEEKNDNSVIYSVQDYFYNIWDLSCNKTVFAKKEEDNQKVVRVRTELTSHYEDSLKGKDLFYDNNSWEELTVPTLKASMAANPTHIWSKEPELWYTLEQLMLKAEGRAIIHTPYAVLSNDMYASVARIAETVDDVKMLINSTAVGDNLMASSDYTRNRNKVLAMGMKTYEFFGAHSSHGKSILIDDNLSIIGSYNLDMRSTYLDTELMLIIHSPELAADLEDALQVLENQSLEVLKDGAYIEKAGVEHRQPAGMKKAIFSVLSWLIQVVRYLI